MPERGHDLLGSVRHAPNDGGQRNTTSVTNHVMASLTATNPSTYGNEAP